MRKVPRHVHRPVVVLGQLGAEPLQVGVGIGAQVHDHVVDRAADAADDLDLGVGLQLVVEAAQGARLVVVREVALGDRRVEPGVGELLLAEGTREEATVVLESPQVDESRSGERVGWMSMPLLYVTTVASLTAGWRRPDHTEPGATGWM